MMGNSMQWFEILTNVVVVLVILDFIINYNTFKNLTVFSKSTMPADFKNIWHKYYHHFVNVLVVICGIGILIRWIF